ncbi:LanC-like protein [Candidatus Bathyarchaeota archaeon]|nr:LanC-like protein [Candidatus Bathyarchaeota archaeon]
MASSRYIPQDTFPEPLTLSTPPASLLQPALERIVHAAPPRSSYPSADDLDGLLIGPTSLAYLFLRLSTVNPSLSIAGHPPLHWAKAYTRGHRGTAHDESGNCGLTNERLSLLFLHACLSRETADVKAFIHGLAPVLSPSSADKYPSELLYGRAGLLYFIRALRHSVPHAALLLDDPIASINRRIMDVGEDGKGGWRWNGKYYIGAGHGDIGIITQLVLTTPSLAPALQPRLEKLLAAQLDNGNWPASVVNPDDIRVQWCHGAPGFVMSLLALREFYPGLHAEIDAAVERGLLRKEPNLCHGILGNAL